MIYGYGRVSTKGQAKDGNSLEAQERLLKEHGAEVIYMDSFTGTKMTRPEFDERILWCGVKVWMAGQVHPTLTVGTKNLTGKGFFYRASIAEKIIQCERKCSC